MKDAIAKHYFTFNGEVRETSTVDTSATFPHDPNNPTINNFSASKLEAVENGIVEHRSKARDIGLELKDEQEKLNGFDGDQRDVSTIMINIDNIECRRDLQISFQNKLTGIRDQMIA